MASYAWTVQGHTWMIETERAPSGAHRWHLWSDDRLEATDLGPGWPTAAAAIEAAIQAACRLPEPARAWTSGVERVVTLEDADGAPRPVPVPGPRATARYAAGQVHARFAAIVDALGAFHLPYRLTALAPIGPHGWRLSLDTLEEGRGLRWAIAERETETAFAGEERPADLLRAVDAALAAIPTLPLD